MKTAGTIGEGGSLWKEYRVIDVEAQCRRLSKAAGDVTVRDFPTPTCRLVSRYFPSTRTTIIAVLTAGSNILYHLAIATITILSCMLIKSCRHRRSQSVHHQAYFAKCTFCFPWARETFEVPVSFQQCSYSEREQTRIFVATRPQSYRYSLP